MAIMGEFVMESKEVRRFWYGIGIVFLWTGIFTDKTYFFSPIGWCLIIVGNIRSRQL